MSLLALLRMDIACTCKGGVYKNRFKKHAQSAVKNISSWFFLGWSVPSMKVDPCLSQDFAAESNYLQFRQRGTSFLPH